MVVHVVRFCSALARGAFFLLKFRQITLLDSMGKADNDDSVVIGVDRCYLYKTSYGMRTTEILAWKTP